MPIMSDHAYFVFFSFLLLHNSPIVCISVTLYNAKIDVWGFQWYSVYIASSNIACAIMHALILAQGTTIALLKLICIPWIKKVIICNREKHACEQNRHGSDIIIIMMHKFALRPKTKCLAHSCSACMCVK